MERETARFDAMVDAVRVGTITAHDSKANAKWQQHRRKGQVSGSGLAGGDLERVIFGLAASHPDLVDVRI